MLGRWPRGPDLKNIVDHVVVDLLRINRNDVSHDTRAVRERELHDLALIDLNRCGFHGGRGCLTNRASAAGARTAGAPCARSYHAISQAHKRNSSLLGRARLLQALVMRRLGFREQSRRARPETRCRLNRGPLPAPRPVPPEHRARRGAPGSKRGGGARAAAARPGRDTGYGLGL